MPPNLKCLTKHSTVMGKQPFAAGGADPQQCPPPPPQDPFGSAECCDPHNREGSTRASDNSSPWLGKTPVTSVPRAERWQGQKGKSPVVAEARAPPCTQHRVVVGTPCSHQPPPHRAEPLHPPKPGSWESCKDTAAGRKSTGPWEERSSRERGCGTGGTGSVPMGTQPAAARLSPSPGSVTPSNQPLQLQGPRCASSIRPPGPSHSQGSGKVPFGTDGVGTSSASPSSSCRFGLRSCLLPVLAAFLTIPGWVWRRGQVRMSVSHVLQPMPPIPNCTSLFFLRADRWGVCLETEGGRSGDNKTDSPDRGHCTDVTLNKVLSKRLHVGTL